MPPDALLDIRDLRSGYGGKPVLAGLNIRVRPGEIVAIIGRNGVGKTTLMKTLMGLLPTTGGEIAFKGQSLNPLPPHARARLGLGYVPQGREVFGRMSVTENLETGLSICGGRAPAGRMDEIHGYFPILQERARQRAGTLSGGQQQQLAIGRVLMGAPAMVFLDEPSEGIQPNIVQDIARLMVRLNAEKGLSVLFVEQNIDMIRAMAQRCYVMDKGRITAELGPDDIRDRAEMRRHLAV
ncbi:ABC transporter ATP-binding protein [Paracoccus aminophilus]|uniref:ABC-type branched-chain amino acid transport systems, ATPase component n=1 Tax=Paracoccus aminophilus JCM 7686 TaxID=1367847 RepID=S5YZT9_PARAH|nr:ABC transporter ATP-binding protein [Paracoccus aminophilus]AGT10726.1 ABC-type branched-chain amino acid transport systems, ATPase component [Paracoccus aminophilus JCM 7686]